MMFNIENIIFGAILGALFVYVLYAMFKSDKKKSIKEYDFNPGPIIRFKRGSSCILEEMNPILKRGEPCFDYDKNILKIGDGKTPWNELNIVNVQA